MSSNYRKLIPLWSGLTLLLMINPGNTQASGLFLPARGVLPIAKGGACTASCPPLYSIWYNPANLAQTAGFRSSLDLGLILNQMRFQRADRMGEEGQIVRYNPVENRAPPTPIPSLYFAYGWKRYRLAVGGGLNAPYSALLDFPDTGPQRYAIISMLGSFFATAQIAIAWAPLENLRIGLSLQNHLINIQLTNAISAYLGIFGAPEDPDLDLYAKVTLSSFFNPSGNIGIWWRIFQTKQLSLEIATAFQFPTFIRAEGEIALRLPTHPLFDPVRVEGKKIRSSFFLPLSFRLGLRALIYRRVDIELGFSFDGWSIHDQLPIFPAEKDGIWMRNVPTIGDYKVPNLSVPRKFQDTFSLRVGASFDIQPNFFKLHIGYIFETGAIPPEMKTPFLYDSNKHLWSAGATFTVKNWAFDLAYSFVLMPEDNVEKSEFRQINPLNPEGAIPIGAGTYSSSYHIFGLSARVGF